MTESRPELLAIRVPLVARQDGPAPPWLGQRPHGLFFALLGQLNPSLAARLHDRRRPNEKKPFTISVLLTKDGRPAERIARGDEVQLRLTLLESRPEADLIGMWPALSQALFPGRDLYLAPPDERLDGSCSAAFDVAAYPEIVQATRFRDLPLPAHDRWRMTFAVPTTFESPAPLGDRAAPTRYRPLPDPELIVRSLGAAWAQLTPPDLRSLGEKPAVEVLASCLQMEASKVTAKAVAMRRDGREIVRIGFTGWAEIAYRRRRDATRDSVAADLRRLSALMRFAEYVGVGSQTAAGMGMVHVEPIPAPATRNPRIPAGDLPECV